MPPLTFDDLIPAAPAGGAALTPADHAAFALQQHAMAQASQGTAPTSAADPSAYQPGVSFAAPAPAANAGPFDDLVPKPPAAARSSGALTFDEFAPAASVPASTAAGDDDPLTAAPATWADTGAAVGNAAHYTDDVVRLLANGATFGLADKAAGATISTRSRRPRAPPPRSRIQAPLARSPGSQAPLRPLLLWAALSAPEPKRSRVCAGARPSVRQPDRSRHGNRSRSGRDRRGRERQASVCRRDHGRAWRFRWRDAWHRSRRGVRAVSAACSPKRRR